MKKTALIMSLITTVEIMAANIFALGIIAAALVINPLALTIGSDNDNIFNSTLSIIPTVLVEVGTTLALILSIIAYTKSKRKPFSKYNGFRITAFVLTLVSSFLTLPGAIWLQSLLLKDSTFVIIMCAIGILLAIALMFISIMDITMNKKNAAA